MLHFLFTSVGRSILFHEELEHATDAASVSKLIWLELVDVGEEGRDLSFPTLPEGED